MKRYGRTIQRQKSIMVALSSLSIQLSVNAVKQKTIFPQVAGCGGNCLPNQDHSLTALNNFLILKIQVQKLGFNDSLHLHSLPDCGTKNRKEVVPKIGQNTTEICPGNRNFTDNEFHVMMSEELLLSSYPPTTKLQYTPRK